MSLLHSTSPPDQLHGLDSANSSCSNDSSPFPIERPLILQPPPIPLDRPDLLAVKIRHGVIRARARGVNAMGFHSGKEFAFFDSKFGEASPVEKAPEAVTEDRADQPAEGEA